MYNAELEYCAVCGELSYLILITDEFCGNPFCPTNMDEEDFIEEFVNRLLEEETEEYGIAIQDWDESLPDFTEAGSED